MIGSEKKITKAAGKSVEEVTMADVLLIIGSTGEVMPAGMLPSIAKSMGQRLLILIHGGRHFQLL